LGGFLVEYENMEETTQKNIQKPPFPIKTKIFAWWTIILGGILLILIARIARIARSGSAWDYYFDFFAESLFTAILIFVPSIFILFRKKSAWWVSRIYLWIVLIIGVLSFINRFIHIPIDTTTIEGVTSYAITDIYMFFIPVTLYLKIPITTLHIIPLLIIFIPIIFLELDRKNFNNIVKNTSLPIKAEIAYLLIGIDLFILFIYALFNQLVLPEREEVLKYLIFFIITSTIFLPLLKRKWWAWKTSVTIISLLLCLYLAVLIGSSISSNSFVYFIDILCLFLLTFLSLILIILDRKNFFKIVS